MKKQLLLFLCIIMSHSVQLQGISSKNALPTLFKELKHIESQLNQLNKHITPADTFFRNSNFTMPPYQR